MSAQLSNMFVGEISDSATLYTFATTIIKFSDKLTDDLYLSPKTDLF